MRHRRLACRPATLLGVACTGAVVGLFVFERYLVNSSSSCVALCSAHRTLSYHLLQRNEAGERVQHHPRVKTFETNFLPSNSPMEDRFVVGVSGGLGVALFSVIDGHKGYRCSAHLQKHLLGHIVSSIYACADLSGEPDLSILMDMDSHRHSEHREVKDASGNRVAIPPEVMTSCLRDSFRSLDDNISREALEDVKTVLKGHSFTAEMKRRVMTAIEGACAIAAVVLDNDVYVASTGDCRVVLARKVSNKIWKAMPLSVDQNANNPAEVKRLRDEHPGEEQTLIMDGRVLGNLMPFRTFGDCDFKWEGKYLEKIVSLPLAYRSPPYITAEPVVTHFKLEDEDHFMIIASDGLWERMSNEEVVNVVAQTLTNRFKKSGLLSSLFGGAKEECCEENAATNLLWQALGGSEERVAALLNVSPQWSRMARDDITIVVVYFKSSS